MKFTRKLNVHAVAVFPRVVVVAPVAVARVADAVPGASASAAERIPGTTRLRVETPLGGLALWQRIESRIAHVERPADNDRDVLDRRIAHETAEDVGVLLR